MKDALISTLTELLDSKKAIAALASVLAIVLVHLAGALHLAIDPATADAIALKVLLIGGAYIGGQGLADVGKHAAEIKADGDSMLHVAGPTVTVGVPPAAVKGAGS